MSNFINTFRTLYSNKKLVEIYTKFPERLYMLSKNEYPNKIVQEDYNKLPKKYKYHYVLFNGLPLSILFVEPSLIKKLKLFNKNN